MKIRQAVLRDARMSETVAECATIAPHLVLVFGAVGVITDAAFFPMLRAAFPAAHILGCSTAGEITGGGVEDGVAVITALHFASPDFQAVHTPFSGLADSHAAGARLGSALARPGLHNVLLLGQGVEINGSALIDGISAQLPANVVISGGLAGDGGAFKRTYVINDEGVSADSIVAVGFYGDALRFGHGSFGGWKPFGPARKVTRAEANILYELDGAPALEVYKKYLGDYAKDLPASGLLFPFSMLGSDHSAVGLIRTILGVNEADGSLVLAGDVLQNGYLQLMHASTDALVDGAYAAAEAARDVLGAPSAGQDRDKPSLALLVSCVGRKLVMGARVDEEVEAVADVLGQSSVLAGFYSNGEISPFVASPECKLHNQTMTITCIREA
jgi:hypothetical protein